MKNKYPEHMILVKNGIFYNVIGKDALVLEKELEMKKTCFSVNSCKCGISVKSIKSFIEKLENKNLKYISMTI